MLVLETNIYKKMTTTKKALIISICIFIIVAVCAILLILNKGHIGSKNLVNTEAVVEEEEIEITPELTVSVEKEYISATSKESTELYGSIDGEDITEGIEWTSSDDTIAKIVDNELVAVSAGKVTVTGSYDGIESTATVHVIVPIKTMTFTSTSSSIRVGKELQMKLQVTPSDASIDTLTYTSSDEEIATVNSNGIVTGVSAGKVTITVTDSYTETEKSVTLTIKK